MSRLEDELRQALRREEPPAGFAERVAARAAQQKEREPWWAALVGALSRPPWRWATALAMCLLILAGVTYQRERQRRAEGERAKEQLLLALQITSNKLQMAQEHVLGLRR